MRAQPARHHADVAHDGIAIAVTGVCAHEPDRAPSDRPQPPIARVNASCEPNASEASPEQVTGSERPVPRGSMSSRLRSGTIWVSAGPSGMAEEPGPPGLKRTVLSEPGRVTSAYATLVVPAPGSERSSGTVTVPQRAPAIPSQASADGAVASAATSTARASPSFMP
jgi:hypothetical protein